MYRLARTVRWAAFVALSILSYAILAGVCQALTSMALRFFNHEFDHRHPQFAVLMPALLIVSLALFVCVGRVLAWTLPIDGQAVFYTLTTLGAVCALIPIEVLPYNVALNAAVRSLVSVTACGLMLAGARLGHSSRLFQTIPVRLDRRG